MAAEVRNLADRTQSAISETHNIIEAIQKNVTKAMRDTADMERTLGEIVSASDTVLEKVAAIGSEVRSNFG